MSYRGHRKEHSPYQQKACPKDRLLPRRRSSKQHSLRKAYMDRSCTPDIAGLSDLDDPL